MSAAAAATASVPASHAPAASEAKRDAAYRVRPPFDGIVGQSQVTRFLSQANEQGRLSHAYLFCGPVGSGKTETAMALAKAMVCPERGCGRCDACVRVGRRTHPDVHWVEPQGVSAYLAEQIREMLRDSGRAPIRANHKVYIITRADLLRGVAANAFLKTLEEPPRETSFILLARTRESVLSTLASRCQSLAFRMLPQDEAVGLVSRESGATAAEARRALASVGWSTKRACELIASPTKREIRIAAIEAMEGLGASDPLDVLDCARRLAQAAEGTAGELKGRFESERKANEDFLSKGALSFMEKQQQRKLKGSTREGLRLALSVMRTWLRDCQSVALGSPDPIVNDDCDYTIYEVGEHASIEGLTAAQDAISRAEGRIERNVTPQLALEAMLFDIREVLYASRGAGEV